MALRTARAVGSVTGTIGSRSVSSHLAEQRQRILHRRRIGLDEQVGVQRHQLVVQLERGRESPFCQASWNSEHSRGATLEVTEMQPWPPCAM